MLKVKEAIIVEGRYDKIKLSSIITGLIIETNGFSIFTDRQRLQFIRELAKKKGIIILTDSDAAGFKIRNFIGGAVPQEQVKHAYIPDIRGKEKRKAEPSAEGTLGVEGVPKAVILEALKRAGATVEENEAPLKSDYRPITKADLYEDGFSGRADSAYKREMLKAHLGLPKRLSANSLLKVLNAVMDYDTYKSTVDCLNKSSGNGF